MAGVSAVREAAVATPLQARGQGPVGYLVRGRLPNGRRGEFVTLKPGDGDQVIKRIDAKEIPRTMARVGMTGMLREFASAEAANAFFAGFGASVDTGRKVLMLTSQVAAPRGRAVVALMATLPAGDAPAGRRAARGR